MNAFTLENRTIGPDEPPFIIAELSANHGGDIERAFRIIQMSAECGADAVKFQAYTADSLTLDCDRPGFTIEADNPWKGSRLYQLYQDAATPYEWFPELFSCAREAGITPFASPFDLKAVEMLGITDRHIKSCHQVLNNKQIRLARCGGISAVAL